MLLTVINSLMMVLGIDPSPKDGKVAYIHLTIIFSSNPIGGIPFYFYLTCQFVVIVLIAVTINIALVARGKI